MTTDPIDMFRWIFLREGFIFRRMRTLFEDAKRLGFCDEDWMRASPLMQDGTLHARLSEIARALDVGMHGSRLRRGMIMTAGTHATIIGRLLAQLREDEMQAMTSGAE